MEVCAERRRWIKVGADLSQLWRLGGHTSTHPSSIEEEGFAFTVPACQVDWS